MSLCANFLILVVLFVIISGHVILFIYQASLVNKQVGPCQLFLLKFSSLCFVIYLLSVFSVFLFVFFDPERAPCVDWCVESCTVSYFCSEHRTWSKVVTLPSHNNKGRKRLLHPIFKPKKYSKETCSAKCSPMCLVSAGDSSVSCLCHPPK